MQYRGINFLTDPHLTDYPSPLEWLAPKRSTPPALSYEEMPPIDFVVISHNHYDHLDQSTVDMFGNSVVWYVPLGLKSWFLGRGISSAKIIELDWWESHQFAKEVKIATYLEFFSTFLGFPLVNKINKAPSNGINIIAERIGKFI